MRDSPIGLINKFHMSKLTFYLSAKVAHIEVLSTYYNIVFSETTKPSDSNFHMTTTYDGIAKMYANCFGHMANMGTTLIYGKTL